MNATFRDNLSSSIRYLERGRIVYNASLFAVVATVYAWYLPDSEGKITADVLQELFVLAVLSNVAYCAAYPVDLFVRSSRYESAWSWIRRWVIGTGVLFACVIAEFFARQMLGAPECACG